MLLEILMALVLLSLMGVAFLTALNIISSRVIKADGDTAAEALAKSEIEYIKASDYLTAPWSYGLPDVPPSWDAARTVPAGFTAYTVSASATAIAGLGSEIQQITVTVTRGTPADTWEYASCTIIAYKVDR